MSLRTTGSHAVWPPHRKTNFLEPDLANRNAFLLLRWLLIVLTGNLTVFSNIEEGISGSAFVAAAFVLSNRIDRIDAVAAGSGRQ